MSDDAGSLSDVAIEGFCSSLNVSLKFADSDDDPRENMTEDRKNDFSNAEKIFSNPVYFFCYFQLLSEPPSRCLFFS